MEQRIREILKSIPSAWVGLEDFAEWIVNVRKPEVTVELGVDMAYSLIALAHCNPGMVYGFDCFDGDGFVGKRDTELVAKEKITKAGLWGKICLTRCRFSEAAANWKRPKIDLLHIDGSHNYQDVKVDFMEFQPLLNTGAIVMLHDTRSFPNEVGRFFSEIQYPKFEIQHSHGLGVVFID